VVIRVLDVLPHASEKHLDLNWVHPQDLEGPGTNGTKEVPKDVLEVKSDETQSFVL
jgi:hypothetical protein